MKTKEKRKAYVKQINPHLYTVCLEYGENHRDKVLDTFTHKDKRIALENAISYKNIFNNSIDEISARQEIKK